MVKVYRLEMWGWECPYCGHYNETCDDPNYLDSLVCDECFEVVNFEIED